MPTPASSRVASGGGQQRPPVFDDPSEHRVRTEAHVEIDQLAGEDRRREVGQGEADVGGTDIGGEHDAGRRVERELGRRSPARRGGLACRTDQLAGDECVDAHCDGRASEAGGIGELATRPWHAVSQMLQQRADTFHGRK